MLMSLTSLFGCSWTKPDMCCTWCAQFMLFFGGNVRPRVSLPCLITLFGTAGCAPQCYAESLAGHESPLPGLHDSCSAPLLGWGHPPTHWGWPPQPKPPLLRRAVQTWHTLTTTPPAEATRSSPPSRSTRSRALPSSRRTSRTGARTFMRRGAPFVKHKQALHKPLPRKNGIVKPRGHNIPTSAHHIWHMTCVTLLCK